MEKAEKVSEHGSHITLFTETHTHTPVSCQRADAAATADWHISDKSATPFRSVLL